MFQWDRPLDEGSAFVQEGVPSCSDDVTAHAQISNAKSSMYKTNKQQQQQKTDSHRFKGRNIR